MTAYKPIPIRAEASPVVRTRAEFDVRLKECLDALNAFQETYYKDRFANLTVPKISPEPGVKYIRLVSDRGSNQRYCYGFLDYQGNIYKSESWKKPAKHVRGNIFNDNFDIGHAFTEYGVRYLR